MTLSTALTADVATLSVPELDAARCLIGKRKLCIRREGLGTLSSIGRLLCQTDRLLPELNALNARLDLINFEDEQRGLRRKPAK